MLRRTKIVTTLGPATDREGCLKAILLAGANVVRLNFSHGSAEDHKARARQVRALAAEIGRSVAILGDLQGPKIRTSTFQNGKVMLRVGQTFVLDSEMLPGQGNEEAVGLDYKSLPQEVAAGDLLVLDDGRIQLQVIGVDGCRVRTEVTVGGALSNNKGINKKGGGRRLPFGCLESVGE